MRAERITLRGLTVALSALLAGCSSTGSTGYLGGLLTAPGRPVSPVEFSWTADSSRRGTIAATLPTGERFTGKFVQVTREVPDTELVPMVGPIAGFSDAVAREGGATPQNVWTSAVDINSFREEYANRIVATLFGDKGNAMRCGFRLFDAGKGFPGGGTGGCQISYGNGTIAVQF
jgi:hypothetical protein